MRAMVPGFIPLPDRTILCLHGPDTIVLLERLVTNATNDWATGDTRYGALLTPQGKIIADFLAIRTEDGVLLDVANAVAADLAKRLKMFRLRSDVEVTIDPDLQVFAAVGPIPSPEPKIEGAVHIYQDPRYAGGRMRVLAPTGEQVPASDLTQDDYHADRIAAGIPEQGRDFGAADVFPADINMDILGGVALTKGCFVGQEVVSRMHRRGKIRKRTLTVTAPDAAALAPGSDIMAPLPIGTITSRAGASALAVVRVDRLDAASEPLRVNETLVTIEKPAWLVMPATSKDQT